MARLALRDIFYIGDKYELSLEGLNDGVVLIEGDNGTGKSTLCDLIYYGLSGTVDQFSESSKHRHPEISSDTNNSVILVIEIENVKYRVQRMIGLNDLIVTEPNLEPILFPINRRGEGDTFSDWILRKLGIEPVSLHYMGHSGVINILDILRLVYHDQGNTPGEIFKDVEKKGEYVSDSKVFRRAIFELLMGKNFKELYAAISDIKKTEAKVSEVKAKIHAINVAFKDIGEGATQRTAKVIQNDIDEIDRRIAICKDRRKAMRDGVLAVSSHASLVDEKRFRLGEIERSLIDNEVTHRRGREELSNLMTVKENLLLEISQIKKITYAHDQLKLFSPDTCPYCLQQVERAANHCICRNPVDETKYERFFYSDKEYHEMVKSKIKNIKSMDVAIEMVRKEIDECESNNLELLDEAKKVELLIEDSIQEIGFSSNSSDLNDIADQILELSEKKVSLESDFKLADVKDRLDQETNSLKIFLETQKSKVKSLQGQSEVEMSNVVKDFSLKYDELCKSTIENCTAARINSDYEPILNDGTYLEDSSIVSKRLMYYYTLLHLSLLDDNITFPRFLLIDTPETAGVSDLALKKAFQKIVDLVPPNKIKDYQVIITTGIEKYPESFLKYRIAFLTKPKRLLTVK